ncbi:hypothetical protein Q3408_00735 [Staphylococcus saprophyticus]|nr:hypothetical protein Q3408_00735 [Staphylococcus saprophyticus]
MTTNKKDKTEDILEKVKEVLEKNRKNRRMRNCAFAYFFESVLNCSKLPITFL